MLDGAHAKADAINMSGYLKKIKGPKYAICAMMKNKEPDLFIKQFKGIFKKIITISIENEKNCMSAKDLKSIAKKNHFDVDTADSFDKGLKKISSANKKLIVCLGSLYNIGNILNKNYRWGVINSSISFSDVAPTFVPKSLLPLNKRTVGTPLTEYLVGSFGWDSISW